MLSKEFHFHSPRQLTEALKLLADYGAEAKVLAGGMSLMPAMNLGLTRPGAVVSLNHVSDLDYVEEGQESLKIGAMVRHDRVAADPLIGRFCPFLSEAASVIADVQIRSRGTIGGSLAHADPAADYLPIMIALDATLKVASSDGERTIKAREFFVDIMRTELEPTEALVEIEVPKLERHSGSAYVRLARVEGSFAIVNAAAIVGDGSPVVAIGGATAVPVLADVSGSATNGLSEDALKEISEAAYEACEDAYGDLSGSAEYRRALARVYARRAVEAAAARRGHESN
jgi:aerobic carbon-monoxide dehydrogenase medium subunit